MSEAKHPLYYSYIANCVINAFSASIAIILNSLTIHAIRKTSSLPKPLKTLLLSLAVSDLGVGLLVQPFYVALMVKQLQQNTEVHPADSLNEAHYHLTLTFIHPSIFTVVAISIDRFLAIHLHLRYQELVTQKRVVAVAVSVWVLSVLLSLISFWRIAAGAKVLSITIVILGLCFICTTIVYCRIYFAVRRHTNHIQALQVQDGEMANTMQLRKTAISTFYVYLVFVGCNLPKYCAFIASMFPATQSTALRYFRLYSWTLVFLNSSLNPVIYCWKMRDIRHAIMGILRNIFPHRN